MQVRTPWGDGYLRTSLSGQFNAFNVMAALSAAVSTGISFSVALEAAEAAQPVLGGCRSSTDADIRVVVTRPHT